MPKFAFAWLNNDDTFVAGEMATIKVIVLGSFEADKYEYPFNPNITANDKTGNSSYISGVSSLFGTDVNSWAISFTPIMAGLFNVLITDDHFDVFDSSLHFRTTPGPFYPAAGIVSWLEGESDFVAGTKAEVVILPKDAFGNTISSADDNTLNSYNFNLSATSANGSIASFLNVTNKGWNKFGFLGLEFMVATAGSLILHIELNNQTLKGSPLPFKVFPGALDISSCVVHWNIETQYFQLFSVMEGFIHQHDPYGNHVPGFYAFDAEIIECGTNLIMPVTDLRFTEAGVGIQLFSFSLVEPGNFMLVIFDKELNNHISNMPYQFTVYIGYCNGMSSIVNGTGLNHSVAGEVARFSIYLKDAFEYPSLIELEVLQVQILHELDPQPLQPSIHPIRMVNGSFSAGKLNLTEAHETEIAFTPPVDKHINSSGSMSFSVFDVSYTPERSGIYQIRIFCGNIPLNSGHPFRKVVSPGRVNASLSGVVKFAPKISKLMKNNIIVQLVDSYTNPILLQQSKLKLEIASVNRSGFLTWMFVDNKDGSYTGSYLAMDTGTYEICASFDGNRFFPCPFGVAVYTSEYFPIVYNDVVCLWEDESIAFDALENDYFAGDNATIYGFSKPRHGSLLQYGHLFRYTPYKGFTGNDSFSYTISDTNGNLASGSVNISILSIPPQFVSYPSQLQATEDIISPRFGGFAGIEIIYSDSTENISITLSAKSGTVLLCPMLMQFWQPNQIVSSSMNKHEGKAKELTLSGSLEVVNFAIQSIQYYGNGNFNGIDTIRVSTINRNGKNDLDIPIFVEPINDPPFINVPSYVFLDQRVDEGVIFDMQKHKFEAFIGDPDVLNFPGNKSRFVVMLSMEVSSGFLSTNLPAELISTTELKLKSSYQWQPVQTFVTISKHFAVKAKGIRFRGTLDDCNSIMEQLVYHHGGENNCAVLTVTVNDMGNYGCYPDCAEMMSMPLYVEATVNIVRRRPMNAFLAHAALGAAIIMEFIFVFSLGVLLLFFICKCAISLVKERRKKKKAPKIELATIQESHECNSASRNVSDFTGCSSTSFLLTTWPSHFRQRSRKKPEMGESSHSVHLP
nr:protein GAMETE EXPRESSED 2 [Ipomoea batatas]